ncbi:MAG: hypothetical protein ACKVT2_21590 [Saprospiraceae bacterium]
MTKNLILCLLVCFLGTSAIFAQDADGGRKGQPKVGLDLMGGAMFFSDQSEAATVFGANVWTTISQSDDDSRLNWRVAVEIPWWWRRPIKDPWMRRPPIIIWPPFPPPPNPDPWVDFPLEQVQLGRTLLVSPSLALSFGGDKLSFQVFGGGGFQHIQANSTELRGLSYRTTDSTSPLLSYGAAARYALTNEISAKVEFRAMKTFDGNMSVIGPDGSIALFEGMAMTTPMLTAGIGIGLR